MTGIVLSGFPASAPSWGCHGRTGLGRLAAHENPPPENPGGL